MKSFIDLLHAAAGPSMGAQLRRMQGELDAAQLRAAHLEAANEDLLDQLVSAEDAATFLWQVSSDAQRHLIHGEWKEAREVLSAVSYRMGLYKKGRLTMPWHIDEDEPCSIEEA